MGLTNPRYNTANIAKELGVNENNLKDAMRKNRIGGVVKIWSVENKGKYSVAEMSQSKKHNEGDYVAGVLTDSGYDMQWTNKFVRLIGQAHEKMAETDIPKGGLYIRLLNYEVRSKYDRDKQKEYTNYTVMALEVLPPTSWKNSGGNNSAEQKPKSNVAADGSQLPF